MAKLLFIEDYESVQELVEMLQLRNLVVLVSKRLLEQEGVDLEKAHSLFENYDCGGEADVHIDIVTSTSHYFFKKLKESQHG